MPNHPAPEITISATPIDYPAALARMEARVEACLAHQAPEWLWFLEHPPLYTAGSSARDSDISNPAGLPVYHIGRGGQHTYHGPGQRVVYLVLDLNKRQPDLRWYVRQLESWLIASLNDCGVSGQTVAGRSGVWVATTLGLQKIAAIGVRVKRWVTSHGVAINVAPNLGHFSGIVPCGIQDAGVTSLAALNNTTTMTTLDNSLKQHFTRFF